MSAPTDAQIEAAARAWYDAEYSPIWTKEKLDRSWPIAREQCIPRARVALTAAAQVQPVVEAEEWTEPTYLTALTQLRVAIDEQVARDMVATAVRRHCTLDTYKILAEPNPGDRLIYAVADWIENPPEWVKFK